MQCPTCPSSTLVMTERSGIEIDYCPTCRGVWLDRGELDKIIERSVAPSVPAPAAVPAAAGMPLPADDRRWRERDRDRDRDDSDEYPRPVQYDKHGRPKKKRSSIFEELFDF